MATRRSITRLVAEIDGERYELVPAEQGPAGCATCAFSGVCGNAHELDVPAFAGLPLCCHLDHVYRKIEREA